MEDAFEWFVGIDWASKAHEVCILDAAGHTLERRSVSHSGSGLRELADRLTGLAAGQPERVAVAIEVPHGAVVDMLLERGLAVHSVNPKQLDRFRDRFSPAGAKDDRRDALVLASALRTDGQYFRRLAIQPAQIIRLRELVRTEERLAQDLRRAANQLWSQLQRFYPQILTLCPAADEPWVWELLRRGPTPERGRRLQRRVLGQILAAHRIRRLTADQVHDILAAPALVVAPGTAEAASEHISLLLAQLKLLHEQLTQVQRHTSQLLEQLATAPEPRGREHRDVTVLQSLPGVGRKISATMLAQAQEAIQEADYHSLRLRSGTAPVTIASGKSRRVRMRRACDERLSCAVHYMASAALIHDPATRAHYRQLRAAGHSHNRALRSVADRLLRILCAMLRDGTLYDPNRFSAASSDTTLAA